jgi:hypothetical protein
MVNKFKLTDVGYGPLIASIGALFISAIAHLLE